MAQDQKVQVLTDILALRHSCRAYLSDEVPRQTVDSILAMAQRTASWCNTQGWQVVVTSKPATDRLRESLARHIHDADQFNDFDCPEYQGIHLQRRRECGLQLYSATGVARGDLEAANRQRMENFRFFGAPHLALITTEATLGTYGAVDCGGYVNTFMLAAQAHGLASIAQAALAAYAPFWREYFSLPETLRVVCGISFGFEVPQHVANSFRTSRAPIRDAARWVD